MRAVPPLLSYKWPLMNTKVYRKHKLQESVDETVDYVLTIKKQYTIYYVTAPE